MQEEREAMNQNQMRIAIAEACGWKIEPCPQPGLRYITTPTGDTGFTDLHRGIPDYLNNLNAMHEAVETLDEKQFAVFCWALANMLEAFDWDRSSEDLRKVMEATALQRAEAFLRTIEKWEGK